MKLLKSLSVAVLLSSICYADTLVVLNKSDSTASLVDLDSLRVVASVKTGQGPHEVVVSPDGRQAVVTNYGDKVAGSSLTVFDIETAQVTKTIELGQYLRPHGITWVGEAEQVLVTSEESQCIVRVDLPSGKVVGHFPTEAKLSHMVVASEETAYVANIGSGSVSVIEMRSKAPLRQVETGKGAEGIELRPGADELWVTNRAADSVSVLDSKTLAFKSTLKSGAFPIRVKFATHRPLALITNAKSGTLNFFEADTKQLLSTLQFPKGNGDSSGRMFGELFKESSAPIGIAIDPKRNRAFVAHANLDQISVIDLDSFEIVDHFQAGKEPDGMAYSRCDVDLSRR